MLKSIRLRCKEIEVQEGESTTDRQEKVQGYNQEVMNKLTVSIIGGGGLGGEIARGLVKKGVGREKIFDGDTVEISNLSRQFFYEKDLYKNKAICLAENLVKEGIRKTEIVGYPFMFQRAIEEKISPVCDIAVCAPDNDEVRIFASEHFKDTPVIFTGLDQQANTGYIFIQEPGKATFLDAFPDSVNKKRNPCPGTPAIIDIVKIVAGYILFAIDSVMMDRKRNWNYRQFYLAGFVPEVIKQVEKKS